MRFYVAWVDEQGGLAGPVDWGTYFDEYVPLVGDCILIHWDDGDAVTADKVIERYLTYDPDDEPAWLIVLEPGEVPPDRADFARRVNRDFARRQAEANEGLDATLGELRKSPRPR